MILKNNNNVVAKTKSMNGTVPQYIDICIIHFYIA